MESFIYTTWLIQKLQATKVESSIFQVNMRDGLQFFDYQKIVRHGLLAPTWLSEVTKVLFYRQGVDRVLKVLKKSSKWKWVLKVLKKSSNSPKSPQKIERVPFLTKWASLSTHFSKGGVKLRVLKIFSAARSARRPRERDVFSGSLHLPSLNQWEVMRVNFQALSNLWNQNFSRFAALAAPEVLIASFYQFFSSIYMCKKYL